MSGEPEWDASCLADPDGPAGPQPECWCEYVDIGVGMQRVTDELGCPEHNPIDDTWVERLSEMRTAMGGLRLVAEGVAAQMRRMAAHVGWAFDRRCTCPTPVHRMSCGVDATPKVVPK